MNKIITKDTYAEMEVIIRNHTTQYLLFDLDDAEKIKSYHWKAYYKKEKERFYFYTKINNKIIGLLKMLGFPKNIININGNNSDYRKINIKTKNKGNSVNIQQSYINCYHKSGCCEYCSVLRDYPSLQENKGKCHTWETVIKILKMGIDLNEFVPQKDYIDKKKGE